MAGELIPLWIKILYTLFLCVLVPVYWVHWGPRNFLWFSDIALLTTAVALWLESSLLASMMTLAIALPELAWNADFFGRLLSGRHVLGLSGYMFDARKPLFLRALSLFHVVLPILLTWMVHRLGYDRRAWAFQTVVALVVLPATYALTDPADNVNWVYGLGSKPQTRISPRAYLALLMLFFPVVVYLPTHLLLCALF
ncbi:MAG TPA: membrane-associated protein [Methylomirabilota bacterium]|nr:membrane-associated protein [Methylomirabilota bacterium]